MESLACPAASPEPRLTTGEWLGRWLASRVSLCASTSRSYAAHVRGYLVPYLSSIPLGALSAGEREGWRPMVGVWTAAQTAEFLRQVRGHRLYALLHLVALQGLRRAKPPDCGGATWTWKPAR